MYRLNRQFNIKHYARLVLALFVLSVINMAVQLPAHAAMQQSMMSQQMQNMPQGMMAHCKCPPVICDAVASQNDKNIENQHSSNVDFMLGFQPVYSSNIADAHHQPSALQLIRHDWQYRQFSPPPLSISSILHI